MNMHTWMKNVRTMIVVSVLVSLTGCMSVGDGSPHPFTTMFQDYPPAVESQHVFQTSCLDSAGDLVTADIQ